MSSEETDNKPVLIEHIGLNTLDEAFRKHKNGNKTHKLSEIGVTHPWGLPEIQIQQPIPQPAPHTPF